MNFSRKNIARVSVIVFGTALVTSPLFFARPASAIDFCNSVQASDSWGQANCPVGYHGAYLSAACTGNCLANSDNCGAEQCDVLCNNCLPTSNSCECWGFPDVCSKDIVTNSCPLDGTVKTNNCGAGFTPVCSDGSTIVGECGPSAECRAGVQFLDNSCSCNATCTPENKCFVDAIDPIQESDNYDSCLAYATANSLYCQSGPTSEAWISGKLQDCYNLSCSCTPSCSGKTCGSDGCSGSCGTCPNNFACNASQQCVCTPDCSGKTCGSDGCGANNNCGTCAFSGTCNSAQQCVFPGGNCIIFPQSVSPGNPVSFKMAYDFTSAASGGWFCSWSGTRISPNDGHPGFNWSSTDPAQCQAWTPWTPASDGSDNGVYANTCVIRRTNAGP